MRGHTQVRTLREKVWYPEHEKRITSATFRHARHHLIDILDTPCWIGGAHKAEIAHGLPAGHRCEGAKQLEAHHDVVEYAALNGVDWKKLVTDFPDAAIHSDEQMRQFAESEGGLLILCDKHHRLDGHGIHMVEYPVWRLDRLARDGVEFLQ